MYTYLSYLCLVMNGVGVTCDVVILLCVKAKLYVIVIVLLARDMMHMHHIAQ